jgi:hypothetical protein
MRLKHPSMILLFSIVVFLGTLSVVHVRRLRFDQIRLLEAERRTYEIFRGIELSLDLYFEASGKKFNNKSDYEIAKRYCFEINDSDTVRLDNEEERELLQLITSGAIDLDIDGFGRLIKVDVLGHGTTVVTSAGEDGLFGSDDDLVRWILPMGRRHPKANESEKKTKTKGATKGTKGAKGQKVPSTNGTVVIVTGRIVTV